MMNLTDEVIFISYNNKDQQEAQRVGSWIDANEGFRSHIVGFSNTDLNNGIKLTDMLLGHIASCQQIMVVVSKDTAGSWWVPWEVGVGSEKKFKMSSYFVDSLSENIVKQLPEYIMMNPILGSKEDVDDYCDTQSHLLLESRSGQRERGSTSEEVALFRTRIKEKLKSRRGY